MNEKIGAGTNALNWFEIRRQILLEQEILRNYF